MSLVVSFDLVLHPGTTSSNRFILSELSGDKQFAPRALQLCLDSLTLPFISRAGAETGTTLRGYGIGFLCPKG
jgi:hypothetical protein